MSRLARPCDIVQITDQSHAWYPALLIVHEVKSWGVQACLYLPKSNAPGGQCDEAWNRLNWGAFDVVGEARIVPFAPETPE